MITFSSVPWNVLPGLDWHRFDILGHGSYGAVYLALFTNFKNLHQLLVVKTAHLKFSTSLNKETRIINEFRDCPEIIRCFGPNVTIKKGLGLYNIILEYASLGTLSDLIRRSEGCKLPEINIRIYTRMILKGLGCMHAKGYVHCDLKSDNILVFPLGCQHKLADLGLTKEPDKEIISEYYQYRFRGTPIYMPPESVAFGEIGPALDIWSLGCIVIEMITGKLACHGLQLSRFGNVAYFLACTKDRSPKIPQAVTENREGFPAKLLQERPSPTVDCAYVAASSVFVKFQDFLKVTECIIESKGLVASSIKHGIPSRICFLFCFLFSFLWSRGRFFM